MTVKTAGLYKNELRLFLKEKRRRISKKHRKWARDDSYAELSGVLKLFPIVLSFAPSDEEIDLWPLNEALAAEGRLALPRVTDEGLEVYRVTEFASQLERSSFGILEPIPEKCDAVAIEQISCILVPGLGFDSRKHRLGYGGGFYDRLLAKIAHIPAFGVGFKEQLIQDELPTDPHDRRLTRLYLF